MVAMICVACDGLNGLHARRCHCGPAVRSSMFAESFTACDARADIQRGINRLDSLLASGAQPAAALATARQRAQDAVDVLEGAKG